MEESKSPLRGFLREDYRFFHLQGGLQREIEPHYHDFYKLVFFHGGSASYAVEGIYTELRPGDVVLVPMGSVHRVEAPAQSSYDRSIVYISADFLRRHILDEENPALCFDLCLSRGRYVLRGSVSETRALFAAAEELERCRESQEYGGTMLAEVLLVRLLILLTRACLREENTPVPTRITNNKALELLRYINAHLFEDLSIDSLAERFYLSKYHMMRLFRAETGFSIHNYIMDKRLMEARKLIVNGTSANEACFRCGWKEYSAFSRAFKNKFGVSPQAERARERSLL